jgi:hypothetical protein
MRPSLTHSPEPLPRQTLIFGSEGRGGDRSSNYKTASKLMFQWIDKLFSRNRLPNPGEFDILIKR